MQVNGVYTLGPKCIETPGCYDGDQEGLKVAQHKLNISEYGLKMVSICSSRWSQAKPCEGQGGLYIGP